MRILIFTTHFYPFLGGLENFILQSSKRLLGKNISSTIVTLNTEKSKSFELHQGLNIFRLDAWSLFKNTFAIPKLTRRNIDILVHLSRQQFDQVHTHTRFFFTSLLGMLFAKAFKIKHVHVEHGNSHVQHESLLITWISRLYDLTVGRFIFFSAWRVIGVSRACCSFSRRLGARSCVVVHNGVDTRFFTPSAKSRAPGNPIVVTYIGRMIHAKGIQHLIEAVKGLDDVRLIIVGDGPFKRNLELLARDAKIDAEFPGRLDKEQIHSVLQHTDIFINPSYSEGLPTSVLEAGSMGVPVIATNVGGTCEIIKNGVHGYLIEPRNSHVLNNRIVALLNDNNARSGMGAALQKRVRAEFDWERLVAQMIQVLEG